MKIRLSENELKDIILTNLDKQGLKTQDATVEFYGKGTEPWPVNFAYIEIDLDGLER